MKNNKRRKIRVKARKSGLTAISEFARVCSVNNTTVDNCHFENK